MALSTVLQKMRDIVLLLTAVPFMAMCIAIGQRFKGISSSLPSSTAELCRNPRILIRLLEKGRIASLGTAPSFVSFVSEGGSDTEPGKEKSVVKGVLTYRPDAAKPETAQLRLFIKIPTARGVPLLMRAVGAVFVSIHREVGFYTVFVPFLKSCYKRSKVSTNAVPLEENIPVNVPRCLFAQRNRWLDRVCLIFEEIDTTVMGSIPDWKGVSKQQLLAQLSQAASIHAATWKGSCNGIQFVTERKGLGWLEGLMSLLDKKLSPSEAAVWSGLKFALSNATVCLSHADCRPGNMLFRNASNSATATRDDVIMTDWEACSVTPFMWDCTYAMVTGMTVADRRANESEIIRLYLDLLDGEMQLVKECKPPVVVSPNSLPSAALTCPSVDEATKLVRVLYLVIHYFGWMLDKVGGVGDSQGNSFPDMKAWRERVREGVIDGLVDEAWMSNALGGIPISVLREFRAKVISDLQ